MDQSKFPLNPDAAPFIPSFVKSTVVEEHEKESGKPNAPANPNPQHESPQMDPELDIIYLSDQFPGYSEDSLMGIYAFCGFDVAETEGMLRDLEESGNSDSKNPFDESSSSKPSSHEESSSKDKSS